MAEGSIENFQALCRVLVDDNDITSALFPRLIGLTIVQKDSNQNTLVLTIDDTDGVLEMPHLNGRVDVDLGWRDTERVRSFEGYIDQTEWQYQRRTGRLLITHASGKSNLSPAKQPEQRSWGKGEEPEESAGYAKDAPAFPPSRPVGIGGEIPTPPPRPSLLAEIPTPPSRPVGIGGETPLPPTRPSEGGTDEGKSVVEVLRKSAPEGMTIKADPKFEDIKRKFWMQHPENWVSFGKRVADENGGMFRVDGKTAHLVDADKLKDDVIKAVIGPNGNVLAMRIFPMLTRPMWHRAQTAWFDAGKGLFSVLGKVAQAGGLFGQAGKQLEAAFQHRFVVGEKKQAETMSASAVNKSDKYSQSGWILLDGEPNAVWWGKVDIQGARDGVDGPYGIVGITHDYHRGSGYTTLGPVLGRGLAAEFVGAIGRLTCK